MTQLTSYFGSEFLASGTSLELNGFIRTIAECKSKIEEHSKVKHHLCLLAGKMGHPDITPAKMKDYLVCLMHCAMLGYSVDFGVIYAMMATQSGETVEQRRIGYLASALFLEYDPTLGVLLINTVQNDLKSQNYLNICAALNVIHYLQLPEAEDSLLQPTINCLSYPKQIVRKKALIALLYFYQRSPTLLSDLEPYLRNALEDKDPSVVFACLSVWKHILKEHAATHSHLLSSFYRIFEQILQGKLHRSFMYHGVLAPWAQVSLLEILFIYRKNSVGDEEEILKLVMSCLNSAKKKVDAAYAIVLSCIQILGTVENLSAHHHEIACVLDPFLHAKNHTMKYLGLLGLEALPTSAWKEAWLTGTEITNALIAGVNDTTLAFKALDILESLADQDMLYRISTKIQHALGNRGQQLIHQRIAYWFLDSLDVHSDINTHYIHVKISTLASTHTILEKQVMESHCKALKRALEEDTEPFTLLEQGVLDLVAILKRTTSTPFAVCLVQLACEIVGEYSYLLDSVTDITVMECLYKWIEAIQDDVFHIIGLQAIQQVMIRSKTWLSPLEPLLQKYRASPILEKQELARELLGYIEDHRFQQSIQTVDSSFKTENLSANPNRPILGRYELDTQAYPTKQLNSVQGIHAYLNGPTTEHPKQKSPEKQTLHRTRQTRASASSLPIHSSILLQQSLHRPDLHPQTMFAAPNKQSSMLSSLLALELQDTDMTALAPLTTEAFGALWTESTYERKYSLEHTSSHLSFADDLCVQWHLLKVEMIDNELIASHNSGRPILVHAAMQSNGVVDVTLRALTLADLDYFLCGIDLHHSTVGE